MYSHVAVEERLCHDGQMHDIRLQKRNHRCSRGFQAACLGSYMSTYQLVGIDGFVPIKPKFTSCTELPSFSHRGSSMDGMIGSGPVVGPLTPACLAAYPDFTVATYLEGR